MTKALLLLAEGFEETEAVTVADILRRANIEVTIAGTTGKLMEGSHKIRISADAHLLDINPDNYNIVILPGGIPGYENLKRDPKVIKLIQSFAESGKIVAAICAAPSVLAAAGVLKDKRATIYPGMEKELDRPRNDRVVVDDNIITSQGVGTAIEFGLKIVEVVTGKHAANSLARELVV